MMPGERFMLEFKWKRAGLLGLALTALSACTQGASPDSVNQFAAAGVAFTNTVSDLVDESFRLTVKSDSGILIQGRSAIDRAAAAKELEGSDTDLRDRLAILRDFRAHSNVLRAYFLELQSLAQSNAPTEASTAAGSLVGKATALGLNLKSATIANKSIEDLIPAAVRIGVSNLQSAALQRELEASAETMERELALTEAFLTALAEAAQADFESIQAAQNRDTIGRPYIEKDIPADWAERRVAAFRAELKFTALDDAQDASRLLRANFIQLAEGRTNGANLAALIQRVSAVVAFFEGA